MFSLLLPQRGNCKIDQKLQLLLAIRPLSTPCLQILSYLNIFIIVGIIILSSNLCFFVRKFFTTYSFILTYFWLKPLTCVVTVQCNRLDCSGVRLSCTTDVILNKLRTKTELNFGETLQIWVDRDMSGEVRMTRRRAKALAAKISENGEGDVSARLVHKHAIMTFCFIMWNFPFSFNQFCQTF